MLAGWKVGDAWSNIPVEYQLHQVESMTSTAVAVDIPLPSLCSRVKANSHLLQSVSLDRSMLRVSLLFEFVWVGICANYLQEGPGQVQLSLLCQIPPPTHPQSCQ